jgi:hypothetical protein
VKGNFHARFGIGGGESDLLADHTKKYDKKMRQLEKRIGEQGT